MSTRHIQVVWAHPRTDSLTARVVNDVITELQNSGAEVDELDLYRDDFTATLPQEDEPDWEDLDKQYSAGVMEHAARAQAADTVIFIFPVWWFSLPAIMKGYIDRVWNYGLFYGGGRTAGISQVRWIGLAGETVEFYQKRAYDKLIAHHLNIGIAEFCGIDDSHVELLYNSFGADTEDIAAHHATLRDRARQIVSSVLV